MKGLSSAGLRATKETPSLIDPYANPNSKKKKNKARGKTSKGKTESKVIAPQDICEKDILAKHEMCSTSKISKMGSELTLDMYIPDGKNDYLEQKKMVEMEAFFRVKREGKNPYREQSSKSLQMRRLASSKSRDHLISLMPNKESSNMYINNDIVTSAKQELEMIRRHTNRLVGRKESSELNSLSQQSKKASMLREMVFGVRDKTNNSVECQNHVTNIDSRRPHFLAPISTIPKATKRKGKRRNFSGKYKDNKSRSKEGTDVRMSPENEERCMNENEEEFDFYV